MNTITQNTRLGLLGILGIYFTMGTMPLAELLPLNPYQLLFLRGASGVLIFFLILARKSSLERPTKETLILSGAFTIAALSLFEAIKAWGTNLSAVMLDMAVIIPFLFLSLKGHKINKKDLYCFLVAILGSFIALRVWDNLHTMESSYLVGFGWSLIMLVSNGIFIQYAGESRQSNEVKGFYLSVPLVLVGLIFWGEAPIVSGVELAHVITLAIIFSLTVGYANFAFAFLAFKHLKQVTVGLLVLGVTPSIMLGSYLILGKTLGVDQMFGVVLIILALAFKGRKENM